MKRLLCIVSVMNAGGAETFLMKVFRNLDRERFMMDFVVSSPDKGIYDEEILSLGGRIYHITPKSRNMIKNFTDIIKIVRLNHYNNVLRTSQHSLSALELVAAWVGGAKNRIFRSSNSGTVSGSKSSLILHRFFMFLPKYFANVKTAPSTEAAEYMFGFGCINNGEAFILHNGLDIEQYKYSESSRKNVRKEFNISEKTLLVGHVGRFNQQKNHQFLVDVFCHIQNIKKDAMLLLVGEGELIDSIKEKCTNLGIIRKIIFAGVRKDIPSLLSAMDVFIFPSIYEGMPNTVIEAQANGLPCLISDRITEEAKLSSTIRFLSLSAHVNDWADKAIELAAMSDLGNRYTAAKDISTQGYAITNVVREIEELFFK